MSELFSIDDEEKFKKDFVTQFMATWVANNYNSYCSNRWSELGKPPIGDAEFLADSAWRNMVSIGYVKDGDKK